MDTLTVSPAIVADAGVADVIATHFELMRGSSPEESCHVMPAAALEREGAFLLAARRDDRVLGVGALKEFAPGQGEIKSMHTIAAARGQGIARAILCALIDEARLRGFVSLSLETGSAELFAPARALYEAFGFVTCAPFGDYKPDPLSTFMTRDL